MGGHRFVRIVGIALFAAVVTTAAVSRDLKSRRQLAEKQAQRWAKQIGSQAEGMVFEARKRREKDPVGWAVDLLAQGVEPRILKVTRFRNEAMAETEYSELDADQAVFNYYRIFFPEQGLGIHLQIQTPKVSFLGMQSTWGNDVSILVFFLLTALALWGISAFFVSQPASTEARDEAPSEQPPAPEHVADDHEPSFAPVAVDSEKLLREQVLEWVGQARGLLAQAGGTLRDLVKEAESLVQSSARAHARVAQLRERVHGGIADARGARAALQELESAIEVSEVIAVNLMIANGDESAGASQVTAEQLHRQLRQLRKLSAAARRGIEIAEKRLEPVSTDADLAFHALEETLGASGRMDGHITRTTQGMISQARQIQEFRKRASGQS